MKNPETRKTSKESPSPTSYLKYTQIIYQLIGIVALGVGAGYLLDKWLHLSFPVFKILFSFGAVVVALYIIFKQLTRSKS